MSILFNVTYTPSGEFMSYQVQHSEILHFAQSMYLSDFYASQNMQKLFPHKVLTDWSL